MIRRVILLDTETEGFSPKQGNAIEVAMRLIEGNKTISEFSVELKSKRPLRNPVAKILGKPALYYMDKPEYSVYKQEIWEFASQAPIIAYNAPFDHLFMEHHDSRFKNVVFKDYLKFVRSKSSFIGDNSLRAVARRLRIKFDPHHTAMLDVDILHRVYCLMGPI